MSADLDAGGEVPLAFVVLTPDAEKRAKTEGDKIKASIQKARLPLRLNLVSLTSTQLVADNKIRYKHLSAVEFTPVIPKNASGKILRRLLTEQVRERAKAKL